MRNKDYRFVRMVNRVPLYGLTPEAKKRLLCEKHSLQSYNPWVGGGEHTFGGGFVVAKRLSQNKQSYKTMFGQMKFQRTTSDPFRNSTGPSKFLDNLLADIDRRFSDRGSRFISDLGDSHPGVLKL